MNDQTMRVIRRAAGVLAGVLAVRLTEALGTPISAEWVMPLLVGAGVGGFTVIEKWGKRLTGERDVQPKELVALERAVAGKPSRAEFDSLIEDFAQVQAIVGSLPVPDCDVAKAGVACRLKLGHGGDHDFGEAA